MGCFVRGGKNGMGCFVRGGKNGMGCCVRGDKSMRDVLSGVSKNGMGCFVPGCFVLHSLILYFCLFFVALRTKSTAMVIAVRSVPLSLGTFPGQA